MNWNDYRKAVDDIPLSADFQERTEELVRRTAKIAELEKAIVAGQGSTVKRNGEVLAIYDVANVVETTDEIIIEGGGV